MHMFQDLNIPVPPPAAAANEPNAKRQRMDSSEVSSNTTIEGTRVYALPNGTVPCNKPLSDLIHLVKPHIRELVEDSNLVSITNFTQIKNVNYSDSYIQDFQFILSSSFLIQTFAYTFRYLKSFLLMKQETFILLLIKLQRYFVFILLVSLIQHYFMCLQLKMWISFMIPKIEDGNNFGVSIQEDTLAEVQSVESEAAAFFDQISRYFISRAKILSKVAKYPHIDDYRRAVRVSFVPIVI